MKDEQNPQTPAPQAAPVPQPHIMEACRLLVAAARRMCIDDVADADALAVWEAAWSIENG